MTKQTEPNAYVELLQVTKHDLLSIIRDAMPKASSPKLALTSIEAARALGISERTLWQLEHDGQLSHFKIGRCKRYAVGELERFIAAQQS